MAEAGPGHTLSEGPSRRPRTMHHIPLPLGSLCSPLTPIPMSKALVSHWPQTPAIPKPLTHAKSPLKLPRPINSDFFRLKTNSP